ncbi:MAG: hypothetical protein IJL07_04985 [Lachnospiraceae bacterium]|nr:hypothetical protein [Lachnospiraceae bacterium]
MKKVFKYLILFALVFSMTIPSKAAEEVLERPAETQDRQLWYDTIYYPITPEMEEFKKYSLSELQAMLNPPQEILDSISNEELASLMLDYPLLKNLFAFDDPKQAIQALEKSCTVFSELLSRKDMISVLLREYKSRASDVGFFTKNKSIDIMDTVFEEIFMEYLFIVYKDQISEEEQRDYIEYKSRREDSLEIVKNKMLGEESLDDSARAFTDDVLLDVEHQGLNNQAYDFLNYGFYGNGTYCTRGYYLPFPYSMTHYSNYEFGTYYIYTLSAPCLRFVSNDYSNSVRDFMNTIYNNYNGFCWLSDATTKYNCHSYVWLLRDTQNNKYWLGNPAGIYNGYTEVNTNGSAQYGDRIVIFDSSDNPVHSAYVTTGNYYLGSIRVESKLGAEGLYNTTLADLMALYQGARYRVYR